MENATTKKIEQVRSLQLQTNNALKDAILSLKPEDASILRGLHYRLQACNSKKNHFLIKDAVNFETGELFDGGGRYWSCGSKLCNHCVAKKSQQNRKHLREKIQQRKLQSGENWQFITFTMPKLGLNLIETRDVVHRAWTLFRKRKYIAERFRCGAKSEEFTLSKGDYHYHIHVLGVCRSINYQMIRQIWTDCLRIAYAEINRELFCDTKDGLAIIKILRVYSMEKTIFEITKYLTKSDSWKKINKQTLIEIARIRRFPRMFEFFGEFRETHEKKEKAIVHKTSLNDGRISLEHSYWRDICQSFGSDRYLTKLLISLENSIEVRKDQLRQKFPHSTLIDYHEIRT